VLRIDPGVSIILPPSWQRGPNEFANAAVLLAPSATATTAAPSGRTVVTVERQKDHYAAVRQLSEVAREVSSTPRYRVIGGWPALERRHLSPSGQPGQRGLVNGGDLIEHLTTAVAADDLLVRIETTLSVDARSPKKSAGIPAPADRRGGLDRARDRSAREGTA
jgi:hypothetical protein